MPNNVGDATDSSGQIAVDFVWGALPIQPNDDRAATISNTGGTTGSTQNSNKTFVVTAASASGGVVTYTAANTLQVGEIVTITGLSTNAFNLSGVAVATASSSQFTVTNAATGTAVTGATAVATANAGRLPGVGADYAWAATTQVASGRLDPALDNHAIVEANYANYPAFIAAEGNYIVTAASGNGTTVTYTSQNFLAPGATVTITGLTASAYNLSSVSVATANATSFTVTNSANAGVITGQTGKVESTTALTAADGAGIGNILVPNVLGLLTASALDGLKDKGFEVANITSTTGVTNTAVQPTRVNVTSTTAATVYVASGTGAYPVGTKVTIGAGTGIPTAVVGTWSVTGGSGSTIIISGTGWTVADSGAITPGTVLTGASGTVKTQSSAAGASVATTGTITITSWA
ncbi:hypothetical protein UFOVP225_52 [uncultured Caudovirales phage]|uniref:PASTA domain-containing protein n=1 Tax=uncultured Caudovirales phage TaxID=2100421 RepID=A0A6J7WRF4_9CAUD|nr:hypothetical protein UFOVP113_65 [uncultured Caudovirales phage]CAB5219302.1 hypothetical protein UFOVP225_52 [uncultured Caudovirales phage]